ncbi:hypothetical protein BJV74DRAFT_796154 [Russula compacta]|nr:hypothetical protein BJV74DRAFT_796154 [Russula compacta]
MTRNQGDAACQWRRKIKQASSTLFPHEMVLKNTLRNTQALHSKRNPKIDDEASEEDRQGEVYRGRECFNRLANPKCVYAIRQESENTEAKASGLGRWPRQNAGLTVHHREGLIKSKEGGAWSSKWCTSWTSSLHWPEEPARDGRRWGTGDWSWQTIEPAFRLGQRLRPDTLASVFLTAPDLQGLTPRLSHSGRDR